VSATLLGEERALVTCDGAPPPGQEKFARWLSNWGAGILTSGALFPPLPMPFRVDYPEDGVGLNLNFLSVPCPVSRSHAETRSPPTFSPVTCLSTQVTVQGEVTPMGSLEVRLVKGRAGPALVATRYSATADVPFPGERQILDKLQAPARPSSAPASDADQPL